MADTFFALPAAHRSSGILASASFMPAAAAYGAGDIMDVAKQFSFAYAQDGNAIPAGALIRILSAWMKIDVDAVPSGQTDYTLHLYSVTPPSAQADNAAWALASGDLAAYEGSIPLGSPLDLGGALYVKASSLNIDVRLASSSLFGRLVTGGAHTAAAVARLVELEAMLL